MTWNYCPRCGSPLEARLDTEERERVHCTDRECGFVHYDNPTPVVAAVVTYDGDVVLARNVGWPETWYGLVTGFLERDEHPDEAVLREVAEELLATGRLHSFIGHYPFPMMNQLIIAYHVGLSEPPSTGPELADIKRVPIEKVRAWPGATGDALRDWLATREDE